MCVSARPAQADWDRPAGTPPLAPGAVHVWRARVDWPASTCQAACPILSPAERSRAERFVFAADRQRYIAAHAMVRFMLAGYVGLEPAELTFIQNAAGKPELDARTGPRLRFNLSHSHDLALCAVTLDHDVGVDLEYSQRRMPFHDIARQFFSPQEAAFLETLPGGELAHAFYRQWVCKEAYLKAAGRGMLLGLDSFSVTFDAAGQPQLVVPDDLGTTTECTLVLLAPDCDYVGAVALLGELRQLYQCQWHSP